MAWGSKEKRNAYAREWKAKNRERLRAGKNEYARQYYQNHRAKMLKRVQEYQRVKAQWLSSLKTAPCLDCERTYPPECMDFDHVRDTKKFAISVSWSRSREETLHEISKCELVCANCHRVRTEKRRKNG